MIIKHIFFSDLHAELRASGILSLTKTLWWHKNKTRERLKHMGKRVHAKKHVKLKHHCKIIMLKKDLKKWKKLRLNHFLIFYFNMHRKFFRSICTIKICFMWKQEVKNQGQTSLPSAKRRVHQWPNSQHHQGGHHRHHFRGCASWMSANQQQNSETINGERKCLYSTHFPKGKKRERKKKE